MFLAYAAYGARRPSGSSSTAAAASSSGTTIPALLVTLPSPSLAAEIDGARFSKLVRAAGLLDASSSSGKRKQQLTPADVDLAFAQACAASGNPASKRLRFDEFVRALGTLAGRGGLDESELVAAVAASGGPRPSGEATVPDFVRFHDDKVREKEGREGEMERGRVLTFFFFGLAFRPRREKKTQKTNLKKKKTKQSTYTGVHARGGPTKFDGGRDLAALCDRSQADVRGVSATFARPR